MSQYWEREKINLGEVKEGSKTGITFIAKEGIPEIISMNSSCGCTTPVYNKEKGELRITYSAKKVPVHLRNTTQSTLVTQHITIVYEDGRKEILSLTVKVIM